MAHTGMSRLTIGFDLRYLHRAYQNSANGGLGGPGVYSRELWHTFARLFPDTEYVALVHHGPLPWKLQKLITLAPRHRIVAVGLAGRNAALRRIARSRYSWLIHVLDSRLPQKSVGLDVFHVLDQSPPFFGKRCPTVITIHDLVPLGAGGLYSADTWLERLRRRFLVNSLTKADWIVCVSESTRNDVNRYLSDCTDKSTVVYPGINHTVFNTKCSKTVNETATLQERFCLSGNYFLHVGVCSDKKNPYKLLEAIKLATMKSKKHFKFVFVGPYQVNKDAKIVIDKLAQNYSIHESIVNLGDVSDGDLAMLYKNALALVFPSLYEGFGFPAVESLACGTQCIVSNTSSLPEVVGKLGILVNPNDSQQIADAMLQLIEEGKIQMIQQEGPNWAQRFSWENAAVNLLEIYRKVIDMRAGIAQT